MLPRLGDGGIGSASAGTMALSIILQILQDQQCSIDHKNSDQENGVLYGHSRMSVPATGQRTDTYAIITLPRITLRRSF